jgi:sugar/nucleoside kinase (ribokinase family)
MRVVTLGDVVLDVIVDVPDGLNPDDDAEAAITLTAGGQAANVAAWAASMGATAAVIGPQGGSDAARLVANRLEATGVELLGVPVDRSGTVVSVVSRGQRTLASDAGDQSWLQRVDPERLPAGVDWLHLSGYPLLRAAEPLVLLPLVERVKAMGARVSLDLSSAALLAAFGVDRFRARLTALDPDVVFANAGEWSTLAWAGAPDAFELVLKQGADGFEVWSAGSRRAYDALTGPVVDATGAGDALSAGYLLGGPATAIQAAASCLAQLGAQPRG